MRQSPLCEKLFIAPGNAGTAQEGTNVVLDTADHAAVIRFAKEHTIGLTVVAPDNPLAEGLVDSLVAAGLQACGPTKAAAKLEWSKAFAKDFMARHGIPTARSRTFTADRYANLLAYLEEHPLPVVIKADGLALGKGVVIAHSHEEAANTVASFMRDGAFGDAGTTVVIEEFLEGTEVSVHAFCDGEHAVLFPLAQDHKRIGEGNTGPNTGGMGTVVPLDMPPGFLEDVKERIVMPVLRGVAAEGAPYRGILYPGLMLTKDGPKVLEFNARFGDPETQSYMRLLASDLVEILRACAEGTLGAADVRWHPGAAATVVLASGGYPGSYEKGKPIAGITEAQAQEGIVVFHAGTAEKDGTLITSGGRVLGVSATGTGLEQALARAYAAIANISFDGMQYRNDIGRFVPRKTPQA
jgi:phosphoribosylamine--glycine ligase